eukprot:525844-Prymnesium_polylepis.1
MGGDDGGVGAALPSGARKAISGWMVNVLSSVPSLTPLPPGGCPGARWMLREHGWPPWQVKQQNSFGRPLKDE